MAYAFCAESDGPRSAMGADGGIPVDGGLLEHLVSAAGAAPSLHNSQPWRIAAPGGTIELRVDRLRTLPVADPHGRAARIACGAALLNLRVAAALGHRCVVRLLPRAGDPTLMATVRLAGFRQAKPEDHRLYQAIWRRHSHRGAFADQPLPPAVLRELADAARFEGAVLDLLDEQETRRLWKRVRAAEAVMTQSPPYQAELERWTAADAGGVEGVPASALTSPSGRAEAGGARLVAAVDAQPHVAAVAVRSAAPADQIRAGQALQRVLLQLTVRGAAASVLYPTPTADGDAAARPSATPYIPLIYLRFGYPTATPPAAGRRGVAALTERQDTDRPGPPDAGADR